ncbi:MAG: hypothetical protein LBQ54_03485 [Planctomycetaceae bacterium]|jgi:hypothetical protein|nr:hypothetical protein [Planctomycetaceae bacterium]
MNDRNKPSEEKQRNPERWSPERQAFETELRRLVPFPSQTLRRSVLLRPKCRPYRKMVLWTGAAVPILAVSLLLVAFCHRNGFPPAEPSRRISPQPSPQLSSRFSPRPAVQGPHAAKPRVLPHENVSMRKQLALLMEEMEVKKPIPAVPPDYPVIHLDTETSTPIKEQNHERSFFMPRHGLALRDISMER